MTNVTPPQEEFLQGLMRGMSQRQAYIAAFPRAKKWKPESVDAQACNLLRSHKVAIRYEELQIQAQEANAITRDAVLSHLKACAFAPWGGQFKTSDQLRAMELICKITGIDTPREEE